MGEGRELYYTDKDGRKQDASLWDEILGDDDQDVIQIGSLPDVAETDAADESPAVVPPLGQVPFTR